jgi:WD40 repeat protein
MSDAINFVKMHAERKNLALKGGKLAPLNNNNTNKKPNANQADDDDDEIYSKDLIITGSLDSVAKSWSIETGECVQTFRGHKGAVTCLATDPLGKLLFTGSADHSIRSWEIMTGQPLKIFTGHQTTIISLLVIKTF